MAFIKNFYSPQQIVFYFDLIISEHLIYKSNQADYLNWFPCDFKLCVEEKVYSFLDYPTLSFEGLKNFMSIFENILEEKRKYSDEPHKNVEFRTFEYCATEGEFCIALENAKDNVDKDIVEVTVWMNAAYYDGASAGYYQGFRFYVSLEDLKVFLINIQNELEEIIQEIS